MDRQGRIGIVRSVIVRPPAAPPRLPRVYPRHGETATHGETARATLIRMGKLIYLLNVSLDGFVETPDHSLDWATVDDELHSWFNDYSRTLDAELYGRGLWETMSSHWPTAEADPSTTETEKEFARIWVGTPKIVFSSTLDSVEGNARLVRGDVGDELAKVRQEFGGDLGVGGATLASAFIRAGLVDEYRLVVHPV